MAVGKDVRKREMGAEAEAIGFGQVTTSLGSQAKDIGLVKITKNLFKSFKQENT